MAVLDADLKHPQIDIVTSDDFQPIQDAVRWLIEQKQHQRIAIIQAPQAFAVGVRRYQAFCQALADAGIEIPPEYVQGGDWSVESGQRAMPKLLQLPTSSTAVFACNDHMAIGAILAAQAMKGQIPADVALLGFDDIPAASWICPKLTTIVQNPTEIGIMLATAIFTRMSGHQSGPQRRYEFTRHLIQRESV